MKINYWWYWFIRVPFKQKLSMFKCFFGQHDGVYGIFGYNGYRVTCYKCDKIIEEGIEFEDTREIKK
jgi:hypothetical protein